VAEEDNKIGSSNILIIEEEASNEGNSHGLASCYAVDVFLRRLLLHDDDHNLYAVVYNCNVIVVFVAPAPAKKEAAAAPASVVPGRRDR